MLPFIHRVFMVFITCHSICCGHKCMETNENPHTYTRVQAYRHVQTCMHVSTYTHGRGHTHTHGYIQTCRHTYSVNSHDEKLVMYNDNNRRKQPCVIYTFYIKEFLLCLGTCVATYRRRRDAQRKSRSNIVSSFPSFQ